MSLNKIGFALAGCGDVGEKHAEAIAASGECRLAAVYDNNPAALNNLAGRYGVKAYGDYLGFLSDPLVDVVSICAPSGLHAAMGIAAAEAGKNVLVEKPMALCLEDADALIEACGKAGVVMGVVHQNRFKPAVARLKSAVEEGRFGRLTHANATVRWNRNRDYYEKKPWRRLKSMGGGVLLNQAIHNIDLLQWLMGDVVSVFGYTASSLGWSEGEDVGAAVLRFKNGALGVIEASSVIYPKSLEETISVFGEKGTVVIGGINVGEIKTWQFDGPRGENTGGGFAECGPGLSPRLCCFEDMAKAVRNKSRPLVDGREGRKALEIIIAIHKSCAAGKEVALPLGLVEEDSQF